MLITVEMMISCIAFIGTLITMYINGRKLQKDYKEMIDKERDKAKSEYEWRHKVEDMLTQIQQYSIELKSLQTNLMEFALKTTANTNMIDTAFKRIDELKARVTKIDGKG